MNIIPNQSGTTPSYFCTWSSQYSTITDEMIKQGVTGPKASEFARTNLNDESLFGKNGVALQHERIRGDLYFVLDDGWDVPYGIHEYTNKPGFGSMLLNEERFPSCAGAPATRLRKMDDRLRSIGWKGAGFWIAAQAWGESKENRLEPEAVERYWRERIRWSQAAGIHYWKVDWGLHCVNVDFRRMLSRIGKEEYPELIIEHCWCMPPANLGPDGRFGEWENIANGSREIFSFSDMFRSYDVITPFSVVSTLDRIGVLLNTPVADHAFGMINCEDEVYLGAALGCALGVMRSTIREKPLMKMDEPVRAVRWQRLAPAFGSKCNETHISNDIAYETKFIESIWVEQMNAKEVRQGSPIAISRGISLPKITVSDSQDQKPYVVAARNPNGAVSVATLRRISGNFFETPRCNIELDVGSDNCPIGVFGHYGQLTLTFDHTIERKCIYAQDLAGDTARDITNSVTIDGIRLIIPGELIDEVGLSNATENDNSEPGIAIVLA